MSDTVAKSEIEDVLSSVKRLVSEEGRNGAHAPTGNRPDRLILTEALRVNEPKMDLRDAAGSLDAEACRKAEVMVLRASYEVRPGEDTGPVTHGAQIKPAANTDMPAEPCVRDLTDSLSAKIEALETAIAQTEDQWEPDGESTDAYAGTTLRQMPEGLRRNEPEDMADAWADKPVDVEEAIELDDEALRQLVAEIVREELQGVLGERITRNLRRLIRREINSALATLDVN